LRLTPDPEGEDCRYGNNDSFAIKNPTPKGRIDVQNESFRLKKGPLSINGILSAISVNQLKNEGMYVILVYDCGEKRVGKMLKLCRKYLTWIQNSVFEGEISGVKLKELKIEAGKFMDKSQDSLIIFKSRQERWLEKEIIGIEKNSTDNFL
jgi:CRISPR-associated protein Cas2